jgi:hypothetical protein
VQWAIQLSVKAAAEANYATSHGTARVGNEPHACLTFDIKPGLNYLMNIWNVGEKSATAHAAMYSVFFTEDNYATIEDEKEVIDLNPLERYCAVFAVNMQVGEDLNAWIIKDDANKVILCVEFECTGAAAHTQQALDGGVGVLLTQLKSVIDASD